MLHFSTQLFHFVSQDKIGSNFSMQYLENLAYLQKKRQKKKKEVFLMVSVQDNKKMRELVMVISTTC